MVSDPMRGMTEVDVRREEGVAVVAEVEESERMKGVGYGDNGSRSDEGKKKGRAVNPHPTQSQKVDPTQYQKWIQKMEPYPDPGTFPYDITQN
ncbi:hypothetical protein L2E82_01447 [Cichorium intybus]|uniref:Uncharacterized protein n=1 Tax=Cichorium intybus TaxID=13427 RepID=A0ACB9GZ08_CICIN|nr:hypothetical protein L2E82_01447 [Cichorium intybus]